MQAAPTPDPGSGQPAPGQHGPGETGPGERNALGAEPSAYLRQHAGNPVHWQPFGDAAFARAASRDVPVFLSIGYAACHWCHVMARESFEDQVTPGLLGFLLTAFIVVLTALLIVDMVRRIRRVRYRAQVEEERQAAAEAADIARDDAANGNAGRTDT